MRLVERKRETAKKPTGTAAREARAPERERERERDRMRDRKREI